jgi:hypothetical protein
MNHRPIKKYLGKLTLLALPAIAAWLCASCTSTPPLKVTGQETFAGASDQGGQIIVNAIQTTNTVLAVDVSHRRVTLKNSATGKVRQYVAGPGVVNFELIKKGDVVQATVVERMSIFEQPTTNAQKLKVNTLVVQGVVGKQPDAFELDTVDFTAKILDINNWSDQVTFETGDGVAHTITVSEAVNLADYNVGDEVRVRATEALALSIEKP